MAFKTEETFEIQTAAQRVWEFLVDPRQVVSCLPGAELTSVQDESTFLGKVKVKVGPVAAAYSGKIVIVERDDAARVLEMTGEGRENTGSGSAKVVITTSVTALPGGGTEVRVRADLDVVGKIAQFGRGMIESVNRQVFRQFAECVRAKLESPPADAGAQAMTAASAPAAQTGPSVVAPNATPRPSTTSESVRPVRLLPLVGRALWEWLGRLVRGRPTMPR